MAFGRKRSKEYDAEDFGAYAAPNGAGRGGDPLGQRRTWLVGRQRPCEIIFQDESISRKHAQIVETAQGFYLSDLRSANGTFVNGYRLTGETRIYEQDDLRFGSVQIRFSQDMLRR